MANIQTLKYRQVFRHEAFRSFWLSFTLSALGDAMTRVALTWFVYELTKSPEALGLLSLTYTGPVILGGLVAGWLLDRFDRRKVMIADNLIRGAAMLLIPLLHLAGLLQLWHLYVVSTVYGALMMVSLAGSPSLVPDLVEKENLDTANALETLSYTLSGVFGPPLTGLLIPLMGAPNVIIFDALSYFLFALVLMRIPSPVRIMQPESDKPVSYRLSDAVRLLLGNKVLLSTTIMFMFANLGMGVLFVWLPILSDQVLKGGAELYGLLLGALAVGEVASSFLVGTITLKPTLGALIGMAQTLSGLAVAVLLLGFNIPLALLSLLLLGFFSAPLTIWAQTLRMQVIPERLRGRTFALLRTLMQSTMPIGGAAAGVVLPLVSLPFMVLVSAGFIGVPGLLGLRVDALRQAGENAVLETSYAVQPDGG
jgi:MFS family permease